MQLTGALPPEGLPRLLRTLATLRLTGSLTMNWSRRRAIATLVAGDLVRLAGSPGDPAPDGENEDSSLEARNDDRLLATLATLCSEGHGWFCFEERYHPPTQGQTIEALLHRIGIVDADSDPLAAFDGERVHPLTHSHGSPTPLALHAAALARLVRQLQEEEGLSRTIEKLLEFSTRFVDRAALLIATPASYAVGAAAGESLRVEFDEPARVPRALPSVMNEVLDSKAMFLGPLPPDDGNRALLAILGNAVPTSSVVIPISSSGDQGGLFYGDVLGDHAILGAELLEVAVRAAGLSLGRFASPGRDGQPLEALSR